MRGQDFQAPIDVLLPFLKEAVKIEYVKPRIQNAIREICGNSTIIVRDLNIDYFHYKSYTNCRIVYRLLLDDGKELIACGEVNPLTRKKQKIKGKEFGFISPLNMILHVLPSDRALPGLRRVMSFKWLSRNLGFFFREDEIIGRRLKEKDFKISVVNYRPRLRCLLRIEGKLTGEGEKRRFTRYIKVYSSHFSREWLEAFEAFAHSVDDCFLRVPAITGISEKNQAIFYKDIEGTPLLEALKGGEKEKIIKRLCRSLRVIHTVRTNPGKRRGLLEELSDLESCSVTLDQLDSDLGSTAKDVFRILNLNSFKHEKWPEVTIHGDFSHEQIFVKKKRILVLDFDKLSLGDYRCDLGNFIANILEANISGKIDKKEAKVLIRQFLKEYDRLLKGSVNREVLRWHTASSLLKLAIRPLRRAESDWRESAGKILIFAKKTLEGKFDYLFLWESRNASPSGKTLSDSLQEELEKEESVVSLRKIWPSENGSWLLLYGKDGIIGRNAPQYRKLSARGEKKIYEFPRDNSLKKLLDAVDRDKVEMYIKKESPLSYGLTENLSIEEIKILSYKPEHRCQLEYLIKAGNKRSRKIRLFGKVYRSYKESYRHYKAFSYFMKFLSGTRGDIFKSHLEPFIVSELNSLFLPHIKGKGFGEILIDDPDQKVVARIADGLRSFHSGEFIPPRIHFWRDEVQVLNRWTSTAGELYPVIISDSIRLFDLIQERGNRIKEMSKAPVHRDFYDKQVIVSDKTIAFIDFDYLALGDPAIDVGNFIAHLILRGIQIKGDPGHFNRVKQKFLGAYLKYSDKRIEERILLYTSSSLLRLACVYLLRPGGCRLFCPLIKESERVLLRI